MALFSKAVLAAKARRAGAGGRADARFEWFIDNVINKVRMDIHKRITIAVQYLQTKVVKNISKPVVKVIIGGRTVVTARSKKGEFPRADTTLLKNTIFTDVKNRGGGIVDGYVGTPLEYGLMLETSKRLDRSFLLRTLREEKNKITRIVGHKLL